MFNKSLILSFFISNKYLTEVLIKENDTLIYRYNYIDTKKYRKLKYEINLIHFKFFKINQTFHNNPFLWKFLHNTKK